MVSRLQQGWTITFRPVFECRWVQKPRGKNSLLKDAVDAFRLFALAEHTTITLIITNFDPTC
jgi:hypothetical protein